MATQPASPRRSSGVAVESFGAGFAAAAAIADHVLDRQAAGNVVVMVMPKLESLSTMHLANATSGARRIAVLRDVASHTTSSTILWIFSTLISQPLLLLSSQSLDSRVLQKLLHVLFLHIRWL